MTATELFNETEKITQQNAEIIKKKFKHLSDVQYTWKPNESTWNIQEIFAHLNEYANFYHRVILKKLSSTRFVQPKENFTSSHLGKSYWSSMKLGNAKNIKRKFNAPKSYDPIFTPSLITGDEINRFIKLQDDFKKVLDQSKTVNIRKVKIINSMSKIIKLRLGDVLLFLVYHNERHIQQALNLKNHPKFPKK